MSTAELVGWCEANGRGLRDDGGTHLHHFAGHVLAGRHHDGDLAPHLVDGLTWARLVEDFEATIGTRRPEGLVGGTARTAPPPGPLDGRSTADLSAADAYGGALAEADNPRRLVARVPRSPDDPPRAARWTYYRGGHHALAFSAAECDHLLNMVGMVTGPAGEPAVRRIPNVGEGTWLHRRLGEVIGVANAAWWRFDLTTLEDVHVLDYRPGDAMDEHTDASPIFPARKLSAVVLLSDPGDYEGGRLEFLHDPVPAAPPPERGTVAVFPATLLHRVTPVTAGRRRSLTAFCIGPPLR